VLVGNSAVAREAAAVFNRLGDFPGPLTIQPRALREKERTMRFGLIPQSPQETAALEQAPHARVLLEPFLPVVTARAITAFVGLGFPEALAAKGKSAAQLASELRLQKDGVVRLLRVLAASGYVSVLQDQPPTAAGVGEALKSETQFELTRLCRETLLEGSPAQLDAWVLHNRFHWRAISSLEDVLASDGVRDLHHYLESADDWANYQRAMLQTARPTAGPVADVLPAPARFGLLVDLGGSHGLYGAAICRRFAPMRSRVIDLPEAIGYARKLGEEEGIDDIVEYTEGDFFTADLGKGVCDAVFMGNVVHHLDARALPDLLLRARDALRNGGVIAIWDMASPSDQPELDLVAEGFSLLFYLTSASTCRSADAHVASLLEAGFTETTVHRGLSPTHILIAARRPN
jgi:SAM-dependent methyltransferase